MQKNSITNKITPCCGLPFSVIYWWVSNLTLNSEADRNFILSKIGQNGTIAIDGWKVLINSGTLEADASLTKSDFLAWFDCEKQPSCEQLKLIIEGYKMGSWVGDLNEIRFENVLGSLKITDTAPTTAGLYRLADIGTYTNLGGLVTTAGKINDAYFNGTTWSLISVDLPQPINNNYTIENTYIIDPEQIVPSEALYNDETLAGDILKRVDKNTGENVNYRETTTWYDRSAMDDVKVDNIVFKKINNKYYRRTDSYDYLDARWFGWKSDGTDNSSMLQNLVDILKDIDAKFTILIPNGVLNTLELYGSNSDPSWTNRGIIFQGVNEATINVTKDTGDVIAFGKEINNELILCNFRTYWKDLIIDCGNKNVTAFQGFDIKPEIQPKNIYVSISNVIIKRFKKDGINCGYMTDCLFDNLTIEGEEGARGFIPWRENCQLVNSTIRYCDHGVFVPNFGEANIKMIGGNLMVNKSNITFAGGGYLWCNSVLNTVYIAEPRETQRIISIINPNGFHIFNLTFSNCQVASYGAGSLIDLTGINGCVNIDNLSVVNLLAMIGKAPDEDIVIGDFTKLNMNILPIGVKIRGNLLNFNSENIKKITHTFKKGTDFIVSDDNFVLTRYIIYNKGETNFTAIIYLNGETILNIAVSNNVINNIYSYSNTADIKLKVGDVISVEPTTFPIDGDLTLSLIGG